MKKLTAGIFTVLMGLVTVNAAEAAVASKGYVDEKVGVAAADITALTQTVTQNKTDADTAIADAKKAGTDAAAALESYKTTNDGVVSGLGTRLTAAEGNITTLQGDVAALTGGENSVANQIADALAEANGYTDTKVTGLANGAVKANTDAITAINNADTGILKQAKDYADGLATNYDASGSAAQALTDAKAYADGLATNYDASGSAAQALTDAKAYADGLATNYDAAGSAAAALADAKTYADQAETDAIAAAATAAEKYIDADELTASQNAQNASIKEAYEAADTALQGNINTLSGTVSLNKTAADTGIQEAKDAAAAASTAAAAAQTQADKGVADAATAQATANAAKTTADAAIPAPTDQCTNPTNKCVLTYNNSTYVWEVIERATDTATFEK